MQEFKQITDFFGEWCCNSSPEVGGCELKIESIQRPVLASSQLEHFREARSTLRNPFAPILRLFLAGQDPEQLLLACSPSGPQLPGKPGEYGKGLDFVGVLRPACLAQKPWAYPVGEHSVLLCDVAVGISWRLPDGSQVYGEWDEEASGVTSSRLSNWAITQTGADLLSPLGWLRLSSGGKAEAKERVQGEEVLSFSLRLCSTDAPAPELREERRATHALRAFVGLERGEHGTSSYARFGLALESTIHPGTAVGSSCSLLLVREGPSIQLPTAMGSHSNDGHVGDGRAPYQKVELGELEEGLWYSIEMRVAPLKGSKGTADAEYMRVDVFAGRGGGGVRRQGLSKCLCSHQSMVCAQDGCESSAHTSWLPTAQVDRGGLVEFDDWVLRRGRPPPPVPSDTGVKPVPAQSAGGSGPVIPLDTVRCAGYDSVFVPRLVTRLKDDKLKQICKIASLSTAKASSVSIDASLRQLVASLAKISNADSEQTTEETEGTLEPEAGKYFRLGGASMGCKCIECVSDAEEAAKAHATWNQHVLPKFKRLPTDMQKELNPSAVAHYDHYVIYNNRQALPRYLIKFTVKELPPPEPAPPEPCWMCSDPPDRIMYAQTQVFINLTEQAVPMCFACASKSAVPSPPEILAPATEEVLDSAGSRALVLLWSEPTCPAPIEMYLLQFACMPPGTEDPQDAEPWQDLFQDFSQRTLTISPALPTSAPAPNTHGLLGVETSPVKGSKGQATLKPGPYCFRVRARSTAGWSDWSKQVFRRIHGSRGPRDKRLGTSPGGGGGGGTKLLIDADVWAASSTAVLNDTPLNQDIASPGSCASEESDDAGLVGSISTGSTVQYAAAWHPQEKTLWFKTNIDSSEVLVHNNKGHHLRTENLPCSAMCLSFSCDGCLYLGSGQDYFAKLDRHLRIIWKVSYSDGPCARGVAAERLVQDDGNSDRDRVFAAFNSGPILELDGDSGAKVRVILVKPNFSMALSLAVVCPGVLAVSDSGRIFLISSKNGEWLRQVAAGYLNAALAFDGSQLLVAPANSQVWHKFKLAPPYNSAGHVLAL